MIPFDPLRLISPVYLLCLHDTLPDLLLQPVPFLSANAGDCYALVSSTEIQSIIQGHSVLCSLRFMEASLTE